jgi:hypothetical protein
MNIRDSHDGGMAPSESTFGADRDDLSSQASRVMLKKKVTDMAW